MDIFAQEHNDHTDTKHLSKAIRVANLKLLEGGRDISKTREEDIYNRNWVRWN